MPAREVEYQEFLERVYEETEDPEWHIRNYPGNETLQRLDEPFRVWVNLLHENLWLKQAGYIFERDELSVTDWKAMRIIENYHCR